MPARFWIFNNRAVPESPVMLMYANLILRLCCKFNILVKRGDNEPYNKVAGLTFKLGPYNCRHGGQEFEKFEAVRTGALRG